MYEGTITTRVPVLHFALAFLALSAYCGREMIDRGTQQGYQSVILLAEGGTSRESNERAIPPRYQGT